MPTYEFQCADCGHSFEERRSFSQSHAPATCPQCGSANAKRLITGGAAILRPLSPGEIGASEYNAAQRSFSRMADIQRADDQSHAHDHDHDHSHEHHDHDHTHDHADSHLHAEPHDHEHHTPDESAP